MAHLELEILLDGINYIVDGWYTPEEPMVMYYRDGSGHPGSPAEFDIAHVNIAHGDADNYVDIMEHLNDKTIRTLEEAAIEKAQCQ